MNALVILLGITLGLLTLLAIWSHLRLRRLTRAVEALAARGDAKELLARHWQPRFGMKSLLIGLTVAALILGVFGTELHRARQQRSTLDTIQAELGTDVHAFYHLGWFGDGRLAELLCDWVHSDWGCRVRSLSIADSDLALSSPGRAQAGVTANTLTKLGNFRDLESLQLTDANLVGDRGTFLGRLSNLRRLSLIRCSLSDTTAECIAKCKELEYLQLHGCDVTGREFKRLAALPNLATLDFSYAKLDDDALRTIGRLTQLQSLSLDWTVVYDEDLAHLQSLGNLKWLSLMQTDVGDEGVQQLLELPALYEVRLQNTFVTPDCREHLQQMKRLKRVWLSRRSLAGKNYDGMCKPMPGIEVIDDAPQAQIEWYFHDNRPTARTSTPVFGNSHPQTSGSGVF